MEKQIGQTKNAGFQFGLRKSFPISTEKAWDFLFSEKGIATWLGNLKAELEVKKEYATESGITGIVKVLNAYSHIRLEWQPKHWKNISRVQIRVYGDQEKATIAIHQEKLLDGEQREEMKTYWNKVMAEIETGLT